MAEAYRQQHGSPVPALHLPAPAPPTPHAPIGYEEEEGPSSSLAATASSSLLDAYLDGGAAMEGAATGGDGGSVVASSRVPPAHTYTDAHSGVFVAHRSQASIAASLKAAAAARHLDSLAAGAQHMSAQAELLRAQFAQEQRVAQAMEAEIASLESEAAAALSLPNMLERRTRSFALGQSVSAARARAAAQAEVVSRARRAFEAADLARDSFEAQKAALGDLGELLRQRKEAENQELALLAQASQAHNAKLHARAARNAARTAEQQRRDAEEESALALANHLRAEEARARHAEEMRHVNAQIAERQAAMDALLAEALRSRTDAVMSLKAHTAAAHYDLMAANLRRKKALARREEKRAHERKELEGAGRNADAIFAARDEQARIDARARKLEATKQERAERLRVQMAAEAAKVARAESAAAKEAAVITAYKRNMGHSVIETTAAGLARARERKEEKRRNDDALQVALLESKRFVPDDASEADDEPQEADGVQQHLQALHGAAAGGVAITNFLAIQHAATDAASQPSAAPAAAGADSSDDEFLPSGGGVPSDAPQLSPSDALAAWKRDNPVPGYDYNEWGLRLIPNHASPHRAALDARKIARALATAKETLHRGKPLVVCGKEYKHTSKFLSEPSRGFEFNDFVVGREERREITLTNVSFSFNHFKILPLDERYADFFSVEYTPVGRMSAGAIAKIAVVFRPKVNEDIDTLVPFLAQTGPFSVPLIARTRKAAIRIAPFPLLDMGACVLGDSVDHAFTLHNEGAVPVDFVVEHVVKRRGADGAQHDDADDDGASMTQRDEKEGQQQQRHQRQQQKEEKESGHAWADGAPRDRDSPSGASISEHLKPLNLSGLVSPAAEDPGQQATASAAASPLTAPTQLQMQEDPLDVAGGTVTGLSANRADDGSDPSRISNPPNWHDSAADAARLAEAQQRELDYSIDYLSFASSGRVEGYSSTKWNLRFTPRVDGPWVHSFIIRFGPQPSQQQQANVQRPLIHWGSPSEFRVEVKGEGTKVPVYVGEAVVDFQTALYGKTYRAPLLLHNRDTTAHKVTMRFPRALQRQLQEQGLDLARWVEFTPAVGYIQKKASLAVQIKVTPDAELWRALRHCTLLQAPHRCISVEQYECGHVYLPLRVDVGDQTLPVHWGLTARLVEPALRLSLSSLDFGSVYTTETKALVLSVENQSPLLQHVAFVRLPPEVAVEPEGGMIALPPFRSAEVNVLFSPNSAIDYQLTLQLRTKLGQHVELPLHARGVKPPLVLQHSQIAFAATPNFTSAHAATFVRNQSSMHRQTVHLVLDEPDEPMGVRESIHSKRSFLTFFPAVFDLAPAGANDKTATAAAGAASPSPSSPTSSKGRSGTASGGGESSARVEVEFRPWLNLDELYAHVNTDGGFESQRSEGEGGDSADDGGIGASHRHAHAHDDEKHTEAWHAPAHPHGLEDEKFSTGSPRLGPRGLKKPDGSAASKSKKKKLTAEQEAELARLRAAEEELRRLEAEKAAAAATAAAEAAARAASLAEEFNSRAALETRERIRPSNDLPSSSVVDFSDRLQLAVREQQRRIQVSSSRIDELERQRRLDDDGYDDDGDDEEQEEQRRREAEDHKYDDSEPDEAGDDFSAANSFGGGGDEARRVVSTEPYSRHARHRVAVHVRSTHVVTGEVSYSCLWMQVSTTTLLPQLEVRPHFVQFGQVALGEAKTMSFEVRNTAELPSASAEGQTRAKTLAQSSVQLCMDTLGYSSHFTVLNALRPLGPGEIQIVVVEFRPRREGKAFKQDLVLRDKRNPNVQVHVPLLGLCISPDLEIILPQSAPATAAAAALAETGKTPVVAPVAPVPTVSTLSDGSLVPLLHLGDCMVHESVTRTFEVRNRSMYPYHYRLSQQNVADADAHAGHVHGSGLSVSASTTNVGPQAAGASDAFYFVPSQGVIPPNGSVHLTVVFTPRVTTNFFPFQTLVRVGNQQLHVQAEVHERQLFVSGGRQLQVRTGASVAESTSPAVALAVQSSSFQLKSIVSGVTQLAPNLIYQNPLAFLDGASVSQASVGGGAVAAAFPLLMSDSGASVWDRVPALADDPTAGAGGARSDAASAANAAANAAGDRGRKKASQGKDAKKSSGVGTGVGEGGTSGSTKKERESSARGSKSGALSVGAGAAAGALDGFDPSAAAHKLVELTFDANRIVDLSQLMAAGAGGSSGSSKTRGRERGAASDPSAQALYLVETLQIGSCALGVAGAAVESSGAKADKEKDAGGSYDITLHSVRDPVAGSSTSAGAAASSSGGGGGSGEKASKSSASGSTPSSSVVSSSPNSSSSLDAESVLSLFGVDPPSGALRPGTKESVHFLFDWNKYQTNKAADGERRVLSVGQWLEAGARITLKGGSAPAHLPASQVIDVRLRVYVD